MTTKRFLSKDVKFKRIVIGFVIAFPLTIMILIASVYSLDFIDNALRDYYVEEEVLGTEDSEPSLSGSYGDVSESDTFVWDWDYNWERDGYYKLDRYLERPEYYIPRDKYSVTDFWGLKDGYNLEMSCSEIIKETATGMNPHYCTLKYNGQIISDNVRYEVYCSDYNTYDNCSGTVSFVVFSDLSGSKGSAEYIAISEYATGSKDWLSLYRLQNGKVTHIPFPTEREDPYSGSWYISLYSFEMYGLYSSWENSKDFNDPIELVTYFHEPSMGSDNNVEGIFRIWEVDNDQLKLKETVVDLYRENDQPHWF